MKPPRMDTDPNAGTLDRHDYSDKLCFVTLAERWRLYDPAFGGKRWTTWCPPTASTLERVFVAESGEHHTYKFTDGEDRGPSRSAITAPLTSAGYSTKRGTMVEPWEQPSEK
jgi:hypothetical protein